jgi:methionine-rich copper-binding protein CopC
MIKIAFYIVTVLVMSSFVTVNAQTIPSIDSLSVEDQREIQQLMDKIEAQEKEQLKLKVKAINENLSANKITAQEAESLKQKAAQTAAINIQERQQLAKLYLSYAIRNNIGLLDLSEMDLNIDLDLPLDRLQEYTDTIELNFTPFFKYERIIKDGDEREDKLVFGVTSTDTIPKDKHLRIESRTDSRFVVGVGFNNTFNKDDFGNENYKFAGSRYFSFGWNWSTRLFKYSNFLRFNYGVEFQFNGLKPENNQFFVENGDQTSLETSTLDLDKSKFRMDNVIIPLHLELTNSRKKTTKDQYTYFTDPGVKFGFGGFVGLNLLNTQKLKYEDGDDNFKVKQRTDMNTTNFLYGISTYIGWDNVQLYGQYNLNPLFSDNAVDEHNVQIGLRFEID